jgi:hypothetical protein
MPIAWGLKAASENSEYGKHHVIWQSIYEHQAFPASGRVI